MTDSLHHYRTLLSAELLESRQLLSTVSITAVGSTGEEVMVVTVGETEVFRTGVFQTGSLSATRSSPYRFEVDDSVEVSDLRINFVNDFFDPGVKDRNLIVEQIRFNGNRTNMDALNVFSTGTWLAEDGVQSGYGRGNILHSNGYFQVADADEIEFNGNVWQASRRINGRDLRVDTVNNELLLSGLAGDDFSISRQIDIEPGQLSVLTVNAWRNVISGSFNDAGAGAGVNFYDADGQLVSAFDNRNFELNDNATDPSDRIQSNQFRVPGNATSAFLWVWVEGHDRGGSNIPLRLTDLRLEPVTITEDVTPPTVRLTGNSALRNNFFTFSVTINDDTALPADPGVIASSIGIEVIDPNGQVIIPTLNGNGTQFGATSQSLTFLVNGDSTGAPNLLAEGAYEVRLLSETVRDDFGNFAPPQSLGDVGPLTIA